MKRNCNLFLILAFTAMQAGAQFVPIDSGVFETRVKMVAGPHFELQTGSNSIPGNIINRFIFGGYIDKENIEHFEGRMPSSLRGGAAMRFEIAAVKIPQKLPENVWAAPNISVFHEQTAGFSLNNDAFRLIFRGNGAYLGQKLNAEINSAKRFSNYGFKLHWEKWTGKKIKRLWWSISPTLLSGYSEISGFRASVLTDSLAQNIDVDWGGTVRTATRNNGIAGWGILAGFGIGSHSQKSKLKAWSFDLTDFGAYKLNSLTNYSRMSPPGAGSINISTSFATLTEIFGGEWFKGRRDSLIDKMQIDSNSASIWVLSPFQIKFGLEFKKFIATLDWRNLPGYIPCLQLRSVLKPITKSSAFKWAPGLTLGGFDNWNIDLHTGLYLKSNIKGGFKANASLLGLESLAMPGKQHGLGVRAGVWFNF